MAGIVVVFDFDKTIIDLESDNWVVDELGVTDSFKQLLPTMPWNSLMDRMMKELHEQGKTVKDIEGVLKRVPVIHGVVSAVKAAHALGCDLRIVSDANVFFIDTILNHLGIYDCFTEINTNPSYFDEEGKLRILPYHDFHTCSHGCNNHVCPPNMCKGLVIERMQASLAKEVKKRMIYLGDGPGDFCPSLKLKEHDYVMPRKDFPAWKLINENRDLIKAEIHGWENGEEQEHILLQIIKEITIEENQSPSVDCKFHAIPINAANHEALSKTLPVGY
ncbi:hypothetical protein P3S68_005689 [Capsicum galapagoense]